MVRGVAGVLCFNLPLNLKIKELQNSSAVTMHPLTPWTSVCALRPWDCTGLNSQEAQFCWHIAL